MLMSTVAAGVLIASIEYEWEPPRCAECKIFDHTYDHCPKKIKEAVKDPITNDGFTEVTCKHGKAKTHAKPRKIDEIKLTKPLVNFVYRPVTNYVQEKGETSKQHTLGDTNATKNKASKNLNKKSVQLKELRNPEIVEGAAVALPMDVVDAISSRFANTLFGYFIGKRLAFPLVENYFNTKEGMESVMENGPWLIRYVPLILNVWTPNIDLRRCDSKQLLCGGVRELNGLYTRVYCNFAYIKWTKVTVGYIEDSVRIDTPSCSHLPRVLIQINDSCPKNPKVVTNDKEKDDGLIKVTKKNSKAKPVQKNKQIEEIYDNKTTSLPNNRREVQTDNATNVHIISTKNYFGALSENEDLNVNEHLLPRAASTPLRALGQVHISENKHFVFSTQSVLNNSWSADGSNLQECVLLVDSAVELVSKCGIKYDHAVVTDREIKDCYALLWWITKSNLRASGWVSFRLPVCSKKSVDQNVGDDVIQAPSRINDYRPISCCNVLFKCISKIIANRIKHCLKTLISPNQSAFISGRSISDNILLTQELMHNYHLDRGTPRCAFKVDIQKAYDTMDWNFLRTILLGFGFHNRMISWIMECVTTTSYSICINGTLHGYFQGKRGLRQGDPLSPYLFTLVMEVLTLMIQRRV
ncbi:putative reverse transcriptase domain, reverse transcriptase zinc-binding domain protein [Tanacetum coccineum]|uniref:Reverse transcriptase domain, reverse transcriptase zinc-binding domain protein n=1 Tax=Tanacetum coccineum TaxID=301880 RepID=A0ABQ5DXW6_9ASTR